MVFNATFNNISAISWGSIYSLQSQEILNRPVFLLDILNRVWTLTVYHTFNCFSYYQRLLIFLWTGCCGIDNMVAGLRSTWTISALAITKKVMSPIHPRGVHLIKLYLIKVFLMSCSSPSQSVVFSFFNKGLLWLWSYGSWIYNYLCNQCLLPLKLWVRIPFIVRCTRYNIMW